MEEKMETIISHLLNISDVFSEYSFDELIREYREAVENNDDDTINKLEKELTFFYYLTEEELRELELSTDYAYDVDRDEPSWDRY